MSCSRLALVCGFTVALAAAGRAQFSFGPALGYADGTSVRIVAADVDADGDLDIVGGGDHSVSVHPNVGGGQYGPRTILAAAASVEGVTTADVDGDGIVDIIACVSNPNALRVYLGLGNGLFAPYFSVAVGAGTHSPSQCVAAHLNGDAHIDLAVSTAFSDFIYILINDGNGGFLGFSNFSANDVFEFAAHDLEGDGDQDLIVPIAGSIRLYLNNGLGFFSGGQLISLVGPCGAATEGPNSMAIGNLNGDTFPDIVTLRRLSSSNPVACIAVLLNNGNGTFAAPMPTIVTENLGSPTLGDFDGDGDDDVAIVGNSLHVVWIYPNDGNGVLQSPSLFATGGGPFDLLAADLDGNGMPDLASTNTGSDEIVVLLNQTAPPMSMIPYPGSGEDLELATGINGPATTGPGAYVKTSTQDDLLLIRGSSPGGSFDLVPPIFIGQVFTTGLPPSSPPGFPQVHVSLAGAFVILDGNASPFGVIPLIPGGIQLPFIVPPGLAGASLICQVIVATPTAANGIFAASHGHEIQFQ